VKALIVLLGEMELEVVKNAKKQGKISVLSMSFSSYCSIGFFGKRIQI